MKKLVHLFAILSFLVLTVNAQVPNPSFETWGGTPELPENWYGNNIPPLYSPISKSTTAHTGTYAVKGATVSYSTSVVGPVLQSGTGATGFPVSQRLGKISFFYQFTPVSGDRFAVNVVMAKGATTTGAGQLIINTAASNWVEATGTITYLNADVPDKCTIQFLILGPNGSDYHVGSFFLLDDVSLWGSVDARESSPVPAEFTLEQNYPNPFNPATTIRFGVPEKANVTLTVFDELGRKVAELINEEQAAGYHTYNWKAGGLSSGMYLYELRAGNSRLTRKLILTK